MPPKETPPPAALLVVETSSVFSFNQAVITIGRTNENDLVVENDKVSRKHAEVRFLNGEFEIVDLNSTGGTYVNGQQIETCKLSEGDVITLANVHLVFGSDEFPVAQSTSKYKYPESSSQKSFDTTTIIRRGNKDIE